MTTRDLTPGNWFRCPVVFYPETNEFGVPRENVELADVRAFLLSGLVATEVTAAIPNVSSGVLAGAVDAKGVLIPGTVANAFYVDVFVPRNTIYKGWRIRLESNDPSPVITKEVEIGQFHLLAPVTA